MTIHRKAAAFQLVDAPNEDGTFEGYASVFGIADKGNDVVDRGAYTKSLDALASAGRKVKMLWQHDPAHPIGVWEEIREDAKGLFVKGRIVTEVEKGREALALLRAGAIDGMSIGYRTVKAASVNGARHLKELDLWEVSLVTFPMLPEAVVTGLKSAETEREFEALLRDAGLSRKEATAVALHGYKGLAGLRDADTAEESDMAALLQSIKETTHKLARG